MTDSSPFISCGTKKQRKKGVPSNIVSKAVEARLTDIFEAAAQESSPDRGSVGRPAGSPGVSAVPEKSLLWQPHDFRTYYDFDKKGFRPKKLTDRGMREIKTSVPRFNAAYTYSPKNHGKEHLYKDFMGCSIEVKKYQVAVHNRSHAKQWRLIRRGSIEEVKARISEVMERLHAEALRALQVFIRIHGGRSSYCVLNHRCEHGIHGDDYLDRIPSEMVINDTVFKKLYQHKTEFKDVTAMKTYIANRSVEEVAPEIARAINGLADMLKRGDPKLDFFEHIFDNGLCDWWNALSLDAQNDFIARGCW